MCLRAPPPSGGRPPQSARDLGSGRSREPGAASQHRAQEQQPAPAPPPGRPERARPSARIPPRRIPSDPVPVSLSGLLVLPSVTADPADMSFPQLGYPQYLSATGPGAYGGERPGVLAAAAAAAAAASSGRPGTAELGAGAGAAAVTSVLGMYAAAGPYAGAPNYSAFLPYAADLSLFSQMVSAPASRAPSRPARAGGRSPRSGTAGAAGPAGETEDPQAVSGKGAREGSSGGDPVVEASSPLGLGSVQRPHAVTPALLGG